MKLKLYYFTLSIKFVTCTDKWLFLLCIFFYNVSSYLCSSNSKYGCLGLIKKNLSPLGLLQEKIKKLGRKQTTIVRQMNRIRGDRFRIKPKLLKANRLKHKSKSNL